MQGSNPKILSSIAPTIKAMFSIQTFMTEIKPVVTERHEFEFRDEPLLRALFDGFPYEKKAFDSDLDGRNQSCSLWET